MISRCLRLFCVLVWLSALAAAQDLRVVHFAWVQGDVQFYRSSTLGWEQAINNISIGGDVGVRAAAFSSAVVELEDGSSIRLDGPAQVALHLSESMDGAPVDGVDIQAGAVEISAVLAARADFRVRDRLGSTYVVEQPSTMRFQVDSLGSSLSVIEGEVEAWGGAGYSLLRDGESYSYQLPNSQASAGGAR